MRSRQRSLLHQIGVPPGAGILFSTSTRRKLFLAFLGALMTAFLDMLGVAALLPMVQLITGQDRETGALGFLDSWVGPGATDERLAAVIGAIVVTCFTLKGVLTIAFRWWQFGFVTSQERATASRLLRAYLAAPYRLIIRRGYPDMMRAINEGVTHTYTAVVVSAIGLCAEAITILGLSILLFVVSPVTASLSLIYFGIAALAINRVVKRHSREAGKAALIGSLRTFRSATNALGAAKEIRLRHNAGFFVEEFESSKLQVADAQRTVNFIGELPKYLLEIVFVLGVALMAVLVFGLDERDQALAILTLFVAAGTRMLPSLVRAMAAVSSIRFGLPAMRLVISELRENPYELSPRPSAAGPRPHGDIAFDGVSFRYASTDSYVLMDITFEIPFGTSLAIVGPSGAGKTTLVDVLLGLHTPSSGAVSVGARNIHDDIVGWQTSIGMVPQEVFWLDESISANIAFGVPSEERDLDKIDRVAREAQLDDVTRTLPEGLDTVIGDRGARLSGGQRQRVGIARALYLDPQLIVFDEATSALDNLTERRVAQTIDDLHGTTTVVIVAHRLSTVRNCDRLIFLKDGRIEASGTFDEVRRLSEEFNHLVELGSLGGWDPPQRQALEGQPGQSQDLRIGHGNTVR